MAYHFDDIIDRKQTGSSKWDELANRFGRDNVIPMWVADMDFTAPLCVQEALALRAQHGVYGYPIAPKAYFDSIVDWMQTRHGWRIDPTWISPASGVVPALTVIVQAFTDPGDGILIQPPVYHPFKRVIEAWGRTPVENALIERDGRYEIDFADLEEKAKAAKVMFLCSPHNPVGRVWSKEELLRVGEICRKHDVLVIADEIHSDLVYQPHRHIPFASLSEAFSEMCITCSSPSKTFNIAGLNTAYIIASNASIRERYETMSRQASMTPLNVFGVEALISAYRGGGPWLEGLLDYLAENLAYLNAFIQAKLPEIRVIQPEGMYLVWLDCTGLNLDVEALDRFFVQEAGIALNEGHIFGTGGAGYQRMNIGCPRAILERALTQLADAVERSVRKAEL